MMNPCKWHLYIGSGQPCLEPAVREVPTPEGLLLVCRGHAVCHDADTFLAAVQSQQAEPHATAGDYPEHTPACEKEGDEVCHCDEGAGTQAPQKPQPYGWPR